MQTAFVARSPSELDTAILAIDSAGTAAVAYSITLQDGSAWLDAPGDLVPVNLASGASLLIDGQGVSIHGYGQFRGLVVNGGSLTLRNLTLDGTVGMPAAGGGLSSAGLSLAVQGAVLDTVTLRSEVRPYGNFGVTGGDAVIVASGTVVIANALVLDGNMSLTADTVAVTVPGTVVPSGGMPPVTVGAPAAVVTTAFNSFAAVPIAAGGTVTSFIAATASELAADIAAISVGGSQAVAGAAYSITLGASITLTADLPAINLPAGASLNVLGQTKSVYGAQAWRGFAVTAGQVTLTNFQVTGTVAQGAAGGGSGLGGGLYVGAGAGVTLQGALFNHTAAIGGAPGGLAAGGEIFVAAGGHLAVGPGYYTEIGYGGVPGTVTGGLGGGPAVGSGLYVQGDNSITLDGGTFLAFDAITDGSGAGGSGANAGALGLVLNGGLLGLEVANAFTGGVTVNAGTLELGNASAAGSGGIVLAGTQDLLRVLAGGPGNAIGGFGVGDTIALLGVPFVAGSTATLGGGTLEIDGGGVVTRLAVSGTAGAGGLIVFNAGGGTGVTPGQAHYVASNAAELAADIAAIDVGGTSAAPGTAYSITLAGNVGLTADLPAINLASGSSLVIDGQGGTLDGGGVARGIYAYAGVVTLRDLTIADAVARGGDGQPGVDAGGGAGGIGGGVFVAQNAAVVLDGVVFHHDSAVGGMGGAWMNAGGALAGTVVGAAGGFGFGGAGGGVGGSGGFGAGGGGGGTGGSGGFGGGAGGSGTGGAGGGGGIGAGGDVFVHAGGGLTILSGTLGAGSVLGGAGQGGGGNGQALGDALFLSGGQSFVLAPPAGKTVVVDGVIADTGVTGEPVGVVTQFAGGAQDPGVVPGGGGGGSSGSSVTVVYTYTPLTITFIGPNGFIDRYVAPLPVMPAAGGTVVLNAANSFSSGVSVNGTLVLGNASSAGSGAITFAADQAVLRVNGAAVPGNLIQGFVPGGTIDLAGIAAVPGMVTASWGGVVGLPLVAGGTASLNLATTGITPSYNAAVLAPDGSGGTNVTLTPAVSVPGAGLFVAQAGRGYVAAAQALLDAMTVPGGITVFHGGGSATVGTQAFVTDAASRVSLTGGAANGQLVVAGNGGLSFTAGAGAGTVVAGGGDNLLDVLGGAGNQVLLLGTGADTVRALAGDDTVDGNTGGKLIMLGSGANYVISHAGAQVDTVMGGSGSASVVSNGNVIATGFGGTFTFDAQAGRSTVFGGTGTGTVWAGTAAVVATTEGSLDVRSSQGTADLILGGGAGSRITFTDNFVTVGGPSTVAGMAGSVTVAAYQGVFLGGTAGGNSISVVGGAATVLGGGDGDVMRFSGAAHGVAFAGAGAEVFDGSGGTGDVTYVAAGGAATVLTGLGHGMVWLGSGVAQVGALGSDTVVGGSGAATVRAGAAGTLASANGAMVFGGAGAMEFVNGMGASTVVGGAGALTVYGGLGGGVFFGSGGGYLAATGGASTLVGGGAGDVLTLSGGGNNLVVGGAGAETLGGVAATGVNAIYAGSGADLLLGGAGTSFLFAGAGSDTLAQGTGLTQFVFAKGMAGSCTRAWRSSPWVI